LREQLAKAEVDMEAKLNAQQTTLAQRDEKTVAMKLDFERRLKELQDTVAAREEHASLVKADFEGRVKGLEEHVAQRDAKIEELHADKEKALAQAAEGHASAIRSLHAQQRDAERLLVDQNARELEKSRHDAAVAAASFADEKQALCAEMAAAAVAAAAELQNMRAMEGEKLKQVEENYAALVTECDGVKAALAEQQEEVQRTTATAAESAALDALRAQEEFDELLVVKDSEIERLRGSLARAEDHTNAEVAALQV
jgi:hypothetical protein